MKAYHLILPLAVLFCGYVHAAPAADSTRVYFHRGFSTLDFSLRDNRRTLDALVERIAASSPDKGRHIIAIYVEGNASPSGAEQVNKTLSRQRAERVIEYLRAHATVPDSLVSVVADGIDWDRLTSLVEKATDLPAQQQLLEILRNTPVWVYDDQGRIVDSKKKQLMDLQGGIPFREMERRFFAELQNTYIEVRYGETPVTAQQTPAPDAPAGKEGTQDATEAPVQATETTPPAARTGETPAQPADAKVHRLALKTNLIYDALLMPSLEVEYRISPRWSVNLEGDMAWWKNAGRHKYYQLATISPEGRYWFKTRKPWHGHYIGLFGGFSWYDLQNGEEGYKGEAVTTGLTYGYMFPITRNLSLEAAVGVGYMHTRYEEYLPIDGHNVYQQTEQLNYFGPLKLKFNLVWRLWKDDDKKGGKR